MGFDFKDRETPIRLRKLLDQPPMRKPMPKQGVVDSPTLTHGWIFLTPSGGIAARSDTTCGAALCTPYYIDPLGELTELLDDSGESQTVMVYNIFSSVIAANVYITAKECFGNLIVDAEDCSNVS